MTEGNSRVGSERNGAGEAAHARSHLYALLATIFRGEPSAELLRRLRDPALRRSLAEAGVDLGGEFDGRAEDDLIEELAVEYARLFLGPGPHIAPYASTHLGGEGAGLWGPATVWVKRFIRDAGFDYSDGYRDLPDHISVELEFMGEMTAREARALEHHDPDEAKRIGEIEAEFVADHLAIWVPAFCEKVGSTSELNFYRVMARLAADFIRSEELDLAGDGVELNRVWLAVHQDRGQAGLYALHLHFVGASADRQPVGSHLRQDLDEQNCCSLTFSNHVAAG